MRRTSPTLVLLAAAAAIAASSLTPARAGGTPVALVTAETENSLFAVSLDDGHILRRVALPADPENVVAGVGFTAVVVSARGHAVSLLDWRSLRAGRHPAPEPVAHQVAGFSDHPGPPSAGSA